MSQHGRAATNCAQSCRPLSPLRSCRRRAVHRAATAEAAVSERGGGGASAVAAVALAQQRSSGGVANPHFTEQQHIAGQALH